MSDRTPRGTSSSGLPLMIGGVPVRKLVDLLLSQVFPLASSMIMTLATAVILGVDGRGRLMVVVAAGGLIGALGFLSLQVGIVRAFRRGDRTAPRRGLVLAGFIGAIIFLAGASVPFLDPAFQVGEFNARTVVLACTGGGLVAFNLVVLRTRQGLGQSKVFRDAWLVQSAVYPVLGIPVAAITHSPVLVVLCWYAALVASTLYAMTRAYPEPGVERQGQVVPIREVLGTAAAAHIGVIGQQLMHSSDVVILGLMSTAAAVGLYSVAVPIAGLIWVFSEALSLMAFDSERIGGREVDPAARRRRLAWLNFVVGVAAAIVIAALSIFVLPRVLPEYAASVPMILLLLPGVVIQGYARIGLSSMLSHARRRVFLTIGITSIALSVLYVPGVSLFGAIGAAGASSVIYLLQTGVVFVIIRRSHSRSAEREGMRGARAA